MATKSVLSQSAQMQSGSAAALGALMNKGGAAGKTKRADATKSVLSAAAAPESAAAKQLQALGSSSKRSPQQQRDSDDSPHGSEAANSKAPESPTSAVATAKAARGPPGARNADATKSVLSQATGLKSGSAMALGALVNQGSSAKGRPAAASKSPGEGATPAVREEDPVLSAGLPTRAEDPQRGSAENAARAGHMPLLHPDDAQQMGYKDAMPQDISVEHSAPAQSSSASSWVCCTRGNAPVVELISKPTCCVKGNAPEVDMISRPKTGATHSSHLIPQEDQRSFINSRFRKDLFKVSLECNACSKEIIQEITEI